MIKTDIRRQYLKLIAKLYDTASQFDVNVLRELRYVAKSDGNKGVERALEGLLTLLSDHRGLTKERAIEKSSLSPQELPVTTVGSAYDFFNSRDIFPSSNDLVSALPFKFGIKPKESRERLARRLVNHLDSLPANERRSAMEFIQSSLSKKMGSGFVSDWSKLIRRL